MATTSEDMRIVLQVGTELRITNEGEVILSNPDPLADGKHTKVQPLGRVAQISYGNDSSRRRILQTAPLGR
jgi:hypothetical protein